MIMRVDVAKHNIHSGMTFRPRRFSLGIKQQQAVLYLIIKGALNNIVAETVTPVLGALCTGTLHA